MLTRNQLRSIPRTDRFSWTTCFIRGKVHAVAVHISSKLQNFSSPTEEKSRRFSAQGGARGNDDHHGSVTHLGRSDFIQTISFLKCQMNQLHQKNPLPFPLGFSNIARKWWQCLGYFLCLLISWRMYLKLLRGKYQGDDYNNANKMFNLHKWSSVILSWKGHAYRTLRATSLTGSLNVKAVIHNTSSCAVIHTTFRCQRVDCAPSNLCVYPVISQGQTAPNTPHGLLETHVC